MIGQQVLLQQIQRQIKDDSFPRFSIFIGPNGSEKNEFGAYIAKKLGAVHIKAPDCKVDTVRDIITASYKVNVSTVYSFCNADGMSMQSKNSLLKITEEPPNKAYFVMTLEDRANTLPTILSRGAVYELNPYTSDELKSYCKQYNYDSETLDIVLSICETPGDIDLLHTYHPREFYDFVSKVVDNIATASGSNVFKIGQSVKFKESDEEGYNLEIFWTVFCRVCMDRGFYVGLRLTSRYLGQLRIKSLNRQMLFDRWILDIREAWADGSY